MAGHLVWNDDKRVYGDAGYTGMGKYLAEEKDAPDSRRCIAAQRGTLKKMNYTAPGNATGADREDQRQHPHQGSHPFHVIKNLFGYRKVRYKGLAKNQVQLFSLFGLANISLAGGVVS